MTYILEMDYADGWQLLIKAKERQNEERAYQFYCSIFPHLEADKRMTFEEYYKKRETQICTLPTEQIVKESQALKEKYGW